MEAHGSHHRHCLSCRFDPGGILPFLDYNRSCSFPTSYQQNQAVVRSRCTALEFPVQTRRHHWFHHDWSPSTSPDGIEGRQRLFSYPDRDGSRWRTCWKAWFPVWDRWYNHPFPGFPKALEPRTIEATGLYNRPHRWPVSESWSRCHSYRPHPVRWCREAGSPGCQQYGNKDWLRGDGLPWCQWCKYDFRVSEWHRQEALPLCQEHSEAEKAYRSNLNFRNRPWWRRDRFQNLPAWQACPHPDSGQDGIYPGNAWVENPGQMKRQSAPEDQAWVQEDWILRSVDRSLRRSCAFHRPKRNLLAFPWSSDPARDDRTRTSHLPR